MEAKCESIKLGKKKDGEKLQDLELGQMLPVTPKAWSIKEKTANWTLSKLKIFVVKPF